jgi:hypothetical protein
MPYKGLCHMRGVCLKWGSTVLPWQLTGVRHHLTEGKSVMKIPKKSFSLSIVSFVTFENQRSLLNIISETSVVFNFLYL